MATGRPPAPLREGQQFGRLRVIEPKHGSTPTGGIIVQCLCECGAEVLVRKGNLLSGATASCGCLKRELKPRLDVIPEGSRFGFWTVLKGDAGKLGHRRAALCMCDCGVEKLVAKNNLRNGATVSCGCQSRALTFAQTVTHGGTYTRLYSIYAGMLKRCSNPNCKDFSHYGGRGIGVCPEWDASFESFRAWAEMAGYAENLTIDRVDSDGNYEPDNCRWVSQQTQNFNKRTTRLFEAFGEAKTLLDWQSDPRAKASINLIRTRVSQGWDIERAIISPSARGNS